MFNENWNHVLDKELKKEYMINLLKHVNELYKKNTVYPNYEDLFKCFKLTDYDKVKVVILGQDPYHGESEAHGLCFSVMNNIKMPPSLRNIFKELDSDLGIKRSNTDLSDWAGCGVLLLNSILTVEKDMPLSHKNIGWETFTDKVIEILGNRSDPLVFILWGNYAKEKKKLIKNKKHLIIESAHPSPLSASRGFFGSKPFSRTNEFLVKNGIEPIKW